MKRSMMGIASRAGRGRGRAPAAVAGAFPALAVVALTALAGCGNAGGNGAPPDGVPAEDARSAPPAAGDRTGSAAAGEAGARQETAAAGPRRSPAGLPETTIRVAGIPVTVEVADTEEARQRGLMNRESLPEDRGMLFVYPEERRLSFWMRNTAIALDIAFIDRSGRIVDIQEMEPYDEETIASREPAMYALEMNRGWFEAHGVTPGDAVEF